MDIVVALGGNAILRRGERGTAEEQFSHVEAATRQISGLIERGDRILITHGNGPQVGDILLKDECAASILPRMPLDICGAESQGLIGYMIQQSLENLLHARNLHRPVISLVTQTLVNPSDPAFLSPKKPIGPYYTGSEAERLVEEKGWHIHTTGKGIRRFRRVVPSPAPLEIIEHASIRTLFEEGFIVVAAGGGGIPVYRDEGGNLRGIEAVVDKDLAAERLALAIHADLLLIVTDVPHAYLSYGTGAQRPLYHITSKEAAGHLREGQFGEGSMSPKIEAAIRFVESGGKAAVITSLEQVPDAVEGQAGTRISRG